MIHADDRRSALERWLRQALRAEPGGGRFSLTPASEDASFRRYFRATLADGRSFIVMDAPPDKENCRPFVHVAKLLAQAGVHAPQVHAADLAAGFLLLSDLGTRLYLAELAQGNPDALMRDAIDALIRWQLATQPNELLQLTSVRLTAIGAKDVCQFTPPSLVIAIRPAGPTA